VRGRAIAVGVLVAFVLAAPLAEAKEGRTAADPRFRLYGAGFGHGLGLSQWGAYGLANEGWSARRIVTHFYRGTRVARHASPSRLRVALVQWRNHVHLEARAGPVQLRVGRPNGRRVGTIAGGAEWIVRPQDGRYRVLNAAGKPVGGLWGGPRRHLFARYRPLGSRLHLEDTGHTYAHGFVELNLHAGSNLRALVVLPVEKYLRGVAEVSTSWPGEAQRAQALASRSYVLERVEALGQHRSDCNCAVRADGVDQVYWGWDREASPGGKRWVAAVRTTRGKAILFRGQPVKAFYHASSGGHTEANNVVWGGDAIPYLRAACDPGDYVAANPYRTWRIETTGSDIGRRVAAATGRKVGTVTRFADTVRGHSGRIRWTTVVGTGGRVRVSGWTLRGALGLRESKVWINDDRTPTGAIRRRYDDLGCAPGLPRSGATAIPGGHRQEFQRGALYHRGDSGDVLWLYGKVLAKYRRLGQARGRLGLPATNVIRMPKFHGLRAEFDGGAVFHRQKAGAHELHGHVLRYFRNHGGAGRFGFPTTDVRTTADGTRWADFDSGKRIRCGPAGRCRIVKATA
jgi:stage II sporulation protein D